MIANRNISNKETGKDVEQIDNKEGIDVKKVKNKLTRVGKI